jgi:hypothetical protein
VQRIPCVEPPEVGGVVGDQNKTTFTGITRDTSVLPATPTDTRDMLRLMTGFAGDLNQFDRQTHEAPMSTSLCLDWWTGCWLCYGCLRGRTRSGYAAA